MVEVGEVAPDFEGPTSDGGRLRLTELRGRRVVLYFYPKASSYGCTIETRQFAGAAPALAARGVQVVGVSVDDVPAQRRFAEHCRVGFPLVADHSGEIARRYGVLGPLGLARRVTFLLDAAGRVVDRVQSLRPGPHLARAEQAFLH